MLDEPDAQNGSQPSPPDNSSGNGPGTEAGSGDAYRVLARKYRPKDFSTLIGQEALVRILTNAIESGRIAQAFILTGVRGVGKTTTARIIAKALNCTGADGSGGPTATPCGRCDNCLSIAEDRHLDVIEMDAASNTGVDNIREVIDGARYRPVAARYKIYIFDEVHMLSKNAFNALLKTLEEPPEHVKFIFATTEIRKVPVTILSRCQRFDLRRVPIDQLFSHFKTISETENRTVEEDALTLVARAADGSVRDGLSILDQAIALSDGAVTAEQVRMMLGLADRAQVFDLFEAVMAGRAADALSMIGALYDTGADPSVILQDMLELTHWLTRAKLTPDIAERPSTPELERTRGLAMAQTLAMPVLTRCWQMLLKGLDETRAAPNPLQAAEMALIRLMHTASLPSPGELIKQIQSGKTVAGSANAASTSASAVAPSSSASGSSAASISSASTSSASSSSTIGSSSAGASSAPLSNAPISNASGSAAMSLVGTASAQTAQETFSPAPQEFENDAVPEPEAAQQVLRLGSFDALLDLVKEKREARLYGDLTRNVHLVRFEPGLLEIRPTQHAPKDLCSKVSRALLNWTGERWMVTVSSEPGAPTVFEQEQEQLTASRNEAAQDPLAQALLREFPTARVVDVVSPD